jgi:hypothetical protein
MKRNTVSKDISMQKESERKADRTERNQNKGLPHFQIRSLASMLERLSQSSLLEITLMPCP